MWTPLWRPPRTTPEKKVNTIVLPINVQNIHWYLAVLHVNEREVKPLAEEKLVNTGWKYQIKTILKKMKIYLLNVENKLLNLISLNNLPYVKLYAKKKKMID